jgi:hypothetical protein
VLSRDSDGRQLLLWRWTQRLKIYFGDSLERDVMSEQDLSEVRSGPMAPASRRSVPEVVGLATPLDKPAQMLLNSTLASPGRRLASAWSKRPAVHFPGGKWLSVIALELIVLQNLMKTV